MDAEESELDLEVTDVDGKLVCPVFDHDDLGLAIIKLYEVGDTQAIINETAEHEVMAVIDAPPELFAMARLNQDVIQDRDLLTLKPPLATGVLWMLDPEDNLKVIDDQNGELICSVEPSDKAEANAKILAAARHLLNVVQGVYYRLKFDEAMHCDERDAPLCRVLVNALREAGVNNVDDIECYEDSTDD